MANRRFIDFPIATTVGDSDIILIWQSGVNKQTTKATFLTGLPENLDELNDVAISGLTNGQILRYDSTTGKWENTDQGNLDLNDLNDVSIVSPSNGQVLVYNSSTSKWENSSGGFVPYTGAVTTVNLGAQTIQAGQFVKAGGTSSQFLKADGSIDSTAYGTGSVTSVGLTMPSAFSVANSPVTTAGTLAVTGAGTVSQYIRGDGSLADFPEPSGGGSSVSYYLNGSVNQGTIGGVAYRELNKVPVLGAGTDFSINANGYIASFITDAGDPSLLEIPGGNWNFETYFSASSGGGSPTFYVELYKVSGTTATLIASNSGSPELIAFGTTLTSYFSTLAVPTTTLALTDRLAIRYYVTHSGRTITLHTEDNHLCQIITTFTTGLTALNGLTAQVQSFAVGTSGTDFNIASATATHTFNLPTASATNRGALSSADWTIFNNKENAITAGTTAQYFRGDKTFQTLNTSVVPELTNLYYTEARVNANANVAANTAARHNAVTLGTANGLSLSTQVLSLGLASAGVTGALSGTDWTTFNAKQNALGYTPVPETRTITINGTTQDLSANRTFNVGTVTSVGLSSATSGVTIGSTPVTTSGTITLAIATASGSQNGLLSSTDWTTFNSKQNALTNPVTGTGTTNYLPKFTGTSTIGNSQIFDNGTNVGIGTATPNIGGWGRALTLQGVSNAAYEVTDGTVRAALFSSGASIAGLSVETNHPLGLYTNGTERIRITSGGNVGIGTSSPSAPLHVVNSSNGFIQRFAGGTSSAITGGIFAEVGRNFASIGTISNHGFNIFTNDLDRLAITSGGNVLIGSTTDNGSKLQVNGTIRSNDTYGFAIGSIASYRRIQYGSDNATSFTLLTDGNAYAGLYAGAATFSSTLRATEITASMPSGNGALYINNSSLTSKNWTFIPSTNAGETDLLLFYTGASAGTRLTVTNSGNVGIGTASTLAKLHTDSTSLDGIYLSSFQTTSGGADTGPVLYFGLNDGVNNRDAGQIKVLKENGTSGNYSTYMSFFTRPNGSSSSERMRITSSGNLLVGTTTDNGARLQVSGSATIGGNLTVSSGNNLNMVTGDIYFQSNGGYGILSANASRLLVIQNSAFGVNGKLTITADAGNEQLNIRRATNTNQQLIFGYHSDGYGRIQAVEQDVAFRPLVLNQSGGNVLIGTTTDNGQRLQVNGAGGIRVNEDGSGTKVISIRSDFAGIDPAVNVATNNSLLLMTNNTERMRITSSGNVLIGSTTDNGSKLQVNGAIRTAQPVGTTSNGWLLGRALVSGTSTPNRWIRVQIGLEYYDILAVYMGTL